MSKASKAMLGNTNAEKWTLEEAEKFCNKVLDVLINNNKVRTLGDACLEAGGYEQLINYLEGKYKTVFVSIKKAREIAKARLINQGLDGDANPAMAIFILKNNHNMKDRHDHTTDDKPINQTLKVEVIKPIDED